MSNGGRLAKMASSTTAQNQRPDTLLGKISVLCLKILFWLVLSLILSIIIEWVGMTAYWPEEGVQHSQNMLQTEINYVNEDFKKSLISDSPGRMANNYSETFLNYSFKKSGIEDMLQWAFNSQSSGKWLINFIKEGIRSIADYIIAAITIIQLFAVRLAILVLAIPAFILSGIVGLVDGLVQRDKRRWGAGRESAFLYHNAKRTIGPFLAMPWIVYLAMPNTVHPNLVILPFAILFGIAISITARSFKKYL